MENILSELAISTIKVNDYLSSYKIVDVMDVFVFEQVWGSTALGFGGWGGSTMTSAWTHVVATYEGGVHCLFQWKICLYSCFGNRGVQGRPCKTGYEIC